MPEFIGSPACVDHAQTNDWLNYTNIHPQMQPRTGVPCDVLRAARRAARISPATRRKRRQGDRLASRIKVLEKVAAFIL